MSEETNLKPYIVMEYEDKVQYQRSAQDTGEIEIVSFYKKPKMTISNPPSHKETIDKLLEVLRGTG